MKHNKIIWSFCLAAALLTGCESVVKDAKPPKQYEKSQVLDGNFIDFSDPAQVYALYQAHYAAQQKDPNYTSYSELRGGLDMFGIPASWSKNFISFDVIDYDADKKTLIYALMTTELTKTDSEYDYIADATVTKDEDGNFVVTETIEDNTVENECLIAAVGFYDGNTKKNHFFFEDISKNVPKESAGSGIYNLIVKLDGDIVAVCYKEAVQFYQYDASQKTYVLDQISSYSMTDIYTSTSFVSSANAWDLVPEKTEQTISDLELNYYIRTTENTVMELDDQKQIQSYMNALNKNSPAMADALFHIFFRTYTSDQLDAYRKSLINWNLTSMNFNGTHSPDNFLSCLNNVPIAGANVELKNFASGRLLASSEIANRSLCNVKLSPYGNINLCIGNSNCLFYVPFVLKAEFSGETKRTYEIDCEFVFKFGLGVCTTNVDWGDVEFTIHDIRFWKINLLGRTYMVPYWIQLEYLKNSDSSSEQSSDSSDDLVKRLEALEASAAANVNAGNKWMDVSLGLQSIGKTYTVLANSQVEIGSLDDITNLMNTERERVKKEIEENNIKYRNTADAAANITAKHIEDLQTMLTASQEEAAAAAEAEESESTEETTEEAAEGTEEGESTEAVSKYFSLSARFCKEDGQTDSDAQVVSESGPELLSTYKKIYDCQEKLKQMGLYVDACQYLMDNEVYDQMLVTMDSKLNDYIVTMNLSETDAENMRTALNRLMVSRGLVANTNQDAVSADQLMFSSALLDPQGSSEEQLLAWQVFRADVLDKLETSSLADYLKQNGTSIQNALSQTVTDLELLKPLAITTNAMTETTKSFIQTSGSSETNEDDFYTVGYEQVLYHYKNAFDSLEPVLYGINHITSFRDELHKLEDETIQISRFDETISETRKQELLDECDQMEKLLKTIYSGSSDTDRSNAEEELNSRSWQIDVDCKIIAGKIFHVEENTLTRSYHETVWSATVNSVTDECRSYVFNDELSSLYFDEENQQVVLLNDSPPDFNSIEQLCNQLISMSFFQRASMVHGAEFFQDMDQAVVASVQYKNRNTSLHSHLPDNRCQIILLSQAEGRQKNNKQEEPKWSFMALPYSKLNLNNTAAQTLLSAYLMNTSADALGKYGFISKKGVNNEMTRAYTVTDYKSTYGDNINTNVEVRDLNDLSQMQKANEEKEKNAATTSYEIKIRGMLRDGNTIFLDNPKLDWDNQANSKFYFLNISLDEGVQLYTLNLSGETGTLERQKSFGAELQEATEGCWFKGWWIPNADTNYNDQGTLGGGTLVLLGLSQEDMKQYSSEEDGTLRELVTDDIRHARLYEFTISADQMNACKK